MRCHRALPAHLAAIKRTGNCSLPAFVRMDRRELARNREAWIARVIIGLPRSFVHMGDDGRAIRRFLLHDQLNTVDAAQLATLSSPWPKLVALLRRAGGGCLVRPPASNGRGALLCMLLCGCVGALLPGLRAAWRRWWRRRIWLPGTVSLPPWAPSFGRRGMQPENEAAMRYLRCGCRSAFALLWLGNTWAFNPWGFALRRTASAEKRALGWRRGDDSTTGRSVRRTQSGRSPGQFRAG